MFEIKPTDALLVIDAQNDFCPGGALAVKGGDEIMGTIDHLSLDFRIDGALIVMTQDWHPNAHMSFAVNNDAEEFSEKDGQVMWPRHCVQGTHGAEFHPDVEGTVCRAHAIIRKGYNQAVDSYSGFVENDQTTKTGLEAFLKEKGITRVFLVGLAFDFCVGWTALDAVKAGFEATVIRDLTRSIAADSEAAMVEQLKSNGVEMIDYNSGEY